MYYPEKEILLKREFVDDKLIEYGFVRVNDALTYRYSINQGLFDVIVKIESGEFSSVIYDNLNDEIFEQFRNESFQGAFVNSVRDMYDLFIRDLVEKTTISRDFEFPQTNRISRKIFEKWGVKPTFPFEKDSHQAFRHDNGKWIGLVMEISKSKLDGYSDDLVEVINLKYDSDKISEIVNEENIFPAYHMNKKYWISVILDESMSDDEVFQLVERSYELTI